MQGGLRSWVQVQPDRVSREHRCALRVVAQRTADAAESRVTCYAGLRLLSKHLGRAVARVVLATGFPRPQGDLPTVAEESAKLAECFKTGVQEVLGPLAGQAPRYD